MNDLLQMPNVTHELGNEPADIVVFGFSGKRLELQPSLMRCIGCTC
jgi:hypothetical protein